MKLIKIKALYIALPSLLLLILPVGAQAQSSGYQDGLESRFSWNNPIIYQVMTDRFSNGDPSNDHAYGRGMDGAGNRYEAGPEFFAGGDFAGLTEKIESGYFNELGVNVLWISAPYEQVHGFVPGGNGSRQSYAYHGYWPLDFTTVDANWGTEEEFGLLVDAAHKQNIRVIIDVVMNHPGYATIADMEEFGFGGLVDSTGWQDWRPNIDETWATYYEQFVTYSDSVDGWSKWWTPDWIRAGLPGHSPCGTDEQTMCLSYLPDFRTDSDNEVDIPDFLARKWSPAKLKRERAELAAFFERAELSSSPRNYLIKWLTDWVRRFGVDGYRVDTAKHVDLETWMVLKRESQLAYESWREDNPNALSDNRDFWMVGEVFGYDGASGSKLDYFDNGFDALINFAFPTQADASLVQLDSTYAEYSNALTEHDKMGFVSYLSSHDTGLYNRDSLTTAATKLMLAPGGVNIFYGDESRRDESEEAMDRSLTARSPMNWDSLDSTLVDHWRTLGQFRNRHPSIASGSHSVLSEVPYTFMRRLKRGGIEDVVIVTMGATGRTRINVAKAFPDDALIRDAVTGSTAFVSFGYVTIRADASGLILLEMTSG